MAENPSPTPPRQLLAFTFPPGSGFEGQLVGALERIESGGAMRIVEGLFVGREPDSGDLYAVAMRNDGAAGMIGRLISFRLDQGERSKSTERALAGPAGSTVRELAATLEPGGAITALLVEHTWAHTLGDAITRIGGAPLIDQFVGEVDPDELWARLTVAASD